MWIRLALLNLIIYTALTCAQDPDILRNATELITSKGYPCEEHSVTTQDGFVLSIQRIPNGRNGRSSATNKPVVFLLHGFLDASTTWVINSAEESLGFILADAGYDVWLGNTRGNIYSRKSIYFTPDQPEFWAWSIDEMGQYDLPAFYSYILKLTGVKKLTHVGHSQGTAQAFAAYSNNQQLAGQVDLFVALAPVAYLHTQRSLFINTMKAIPDAITYDVFGKKGFPPATNFFNHLQKFFPTICADFPWACGNVIFLVAGCNIFGQCDKTNLNNTRLPVYSSHLGGASTMDAVHFLQIARTDTFSMYNYGTKENQIKYGTPTPPSYDLTQVKTPVALFSGGEDNLADPDDVKILQKLLPNIVYNNYVANYEHLDFVWGVNAHQMIYPNVVDVIKKAKGL